MHKEAEHNDDLEALRELKDIVHQATREFEEALLQAEALQSWGSSLAGQGVDFARHQARSMVSQLGTLESDERAVRAITGADDQERVDLLVEALDHDADNEPYDDNHHYTQPRCA